MSSKYIWGVNLNDIPFGKYRLTIAFVLSLLPLWNEQYGSHLYNLTPNLFAAIPSALNSSSLSTVIDFTSISFFIMYLYIKLAV